MNLVSVLMIAFGLSMDAFAVSVTDGFVTKKLKLKRALAISLLFGSFQGIMPLIGYGAGLTVKDTIASLDHWIAFLLLGFIGGKMIYDSLFGEESHKSGKDIYVLIMLAIATSIDALVVGLTMSILNISILIPAIVIAVITFFMSFAGINLGIRFGYVCGKKIEVFGGLILFAIGIKILIEHL